MSKEIINVDNITVIVNRKKVKNINLRINRDKSVVISVNTRVSVKRVEEFVRKNIHWIEKNLNKLDTYDLKNSNMKPYEYLNGEKMQIQGLEYKLMIIPDNKIKVEIEENIIYLYISDTDNYKKKKLAIDKFINTKVKQLFDESLDDMLVLVEQYGINKPELKIRNMKSRWGSCNRIKKKITINHELIKVDKSYLEYVILHELIHFLVSGHNKLFYGYMSMLMPDWKVRKKLLNEQHIL